MNVFKKGIIAATIAASALVSTAPAVAQDRYRERDNTAAVAIGAGIIGLAVGAIAASDNRDRYRDGRRYDKRRAYYRNDGYYRDDRYYRGDRFYRGDRRQDRSRAYDRSRRNDSRDRWRGNDRQRYDSRYYGRRGY